MKLTNLKVLGTAAVLAFTAACGGTSGEAGGATGAANNHLRLAGSSTIQPVAEEAARRFEAARPGARVDVEGGGSSVGASSLLAGAAEIGNLSRTLKQGELDQGLVPTTIGYDGIALIVNTANPMAGIDDSQVVAIYTGETRKWKRYGGADQEIVVVNKEEGRSTLELFEQHFGLKGKFRPDAVIIGPNGQAIEAVARNPHAIAYVSIGSAQRAIEQGTPIKTLPLNGVEATVATVKSGAYPLLRPLTMATKGAPTGLAKEFLDFILSPEGQEVVVREDFVSVVR